MTSAMTLRSEQCCAPRWLVYLNSGLRPKLSRLVSVFGLSEKLIKKVKRRSVCPYLCMCKVQLNADGCNLFEHFIMFASTSFFLLPMSRLFRFTQTTLAFSKQCKRLNTSLLFQTYKFFCQEIEHITKIFSFQWAHHLIDGILLYGIQYCYSNAKLILHKYITTYTYHTNQIQLQIAQLWQYYNQE